jgi:hypothetical protein
MDHARVGSLHMPSWLEIYHVVQQQGFIYPNSTVRRHIRPYYLDNTVSRPICEVKQGQVRLVLAWGTSWEVRMLYIFCSFLHFFCSFFLFFLFFWAKRAIIWLWLSSLMEVRPYMQECLFTRCYYFSVEHLLYLFVWSKCNGESIFYI